MKMKCRYVVLFLLIVESSSAHSQTRYTGKVETGYTKFRRRTITVDPGPNWKGYNLNEGQNGVDLSLINGISHRTMFVGLGIGYQNYEGLPGVSAFWELGYLPLKRRLSPDFSFRVGYNHLWNQYENGKGTALGELGGGINYRLTENLAIYSKTGILFTQQSSFVPIRMGVRF